MSREVNARSRKKTVGARDKTVLKNTRDGLLERNVTTGEDVRISKRIADFDLRGKVPEKSSYSQVENRSGKKRKHKYMLKKPETVHEPQQGIMQEAEKPDVLQFSEDKILQPDTATAELATDPAPENLHDTKPPSAKSKFPRNSSGKYKYHQDIHYSKYDDIQSKASQVKEDDISLSEQPKSKLKFEADDTASDAPKANKNRRLERAQKGYDKTAHKLESAQAKLPKKRRLRTERVFDEAKGKAKRRLYFEKEVKSQGEHIKGAKPLRPVKAAGNSAMAFGHRKIFQVERENVGIEAAHKGEMTAEGVVRTALRHHKTAPYRKAEKLERETAKKSINLSYQKTVAENPKLKSNVISRAYQKRKIKRDYAKTARETVKQAKKAGSATVNAGKAVAGVIKRHPIASAAVILIALLIYMIMSFIGTFGGMSSGSIGGILSASYLAADEDICRAELDFTEWEADLLMEVENAKTTHSGYDEYRYDIADVGHDPFELMAYLTALYHDFSYGEIEADMRELFSEQYELTFTPTTETRYADLYDDNEDGDYEPYDWEVLTVTLTARDFSEAALSKLNDEQLSHYEVLLSTKGSRQFVGSPFNLNWISNVSSHYGYRIHPINGGKNLHRGIDIALPTGTEILSGQDGVVTFAGNNGDYGNVVVIENNNGIVTKYAHCDSLLVSVGQTVSMGDVIGTVGSTGQSAGPHLHMELLKDGVYMNPAFYVSNNN